MLRWALFLDARIVFLGISIQNAANLALPIGWIIERIRFEHESLDSNVT